MPCTILLNSEKENWSETFSQYLDGDDRFQLVAQSNADLRINITGNSDIDAVVTLQSHDEQTEFPYATLTRASCLGLLSMILKGMRQQHFEESTQYRLMKKMASVVAHDVRNPLNNILLATAQFKLDTPPEPDEASMYIDIIERSCDRINMLMTDISEPLSEQGIDTKTTSVDSLLKDAVATVADMAELKDVKIELAKVPKIAIPADGAKLNIALHEILKNAIESMTGAGSVQIGVAKETDGYLLVHISDQGSGIADEHLSYIFHPFFTTKDRKRGLGLTMANKIVSVHGGEILIGKTGIGGTLVTIKLPT